jgi:hypothetical protein
MFDEICSSEGTIRQKPNNINVFIDFLKSFKLISINNSTSSIYLFVYFSHYLMHCLCATAGWFLDSHSDHSLLLFIAALSQRSLQYLSHLTHNCIALLNFALNLDPELL